MLSKLYKIGGLYAFFYAALFPVMCPAMSGLFEVNLERCSTGRIVADVFDEPPITVGREYTFGGITTKELTETLGTQKEILVPHPVQAHPPYTSGMRLKFGFNRKYLMGVSGGGKKYYFKVINKDKTDEFMVKSIRPEPEVTKNFLDLTNLLTKIEEIAEQKLRLKSKWDRSHKSLRKWAHRLAEFQVEQSGRKNNAWALRNKNAQESFENLTSAYRYALAIKPPFALKHLKKINKLVLGSEATKDDKAGNLRDRNNGTNAALMVTATEFQRTVDGEQGPLEVFENLLHKADVPLATQSVLNRINRLTDPRLREIITIYRDLMLIHPFQYADSRTIRPIMAAVLIQHGFNPMVEGSFKKLFTYYTLDEYLLAIFRAQ